MFMDMIHLLFTSTLSGSFRTGGTTVTMIIVLGVRLKLARHLLAVIGERENGNVFLIIRSLSHAHSRRPPSSHNES